jgi:hypothetical protein
MKIVGISLKEQIALEKQGYQFSAEKPNGKELDSVIFIVHNLRHKHDSGYPYLRAFAANGKILYDLGWHDHYICDEKTNADALSKNIWRVMKFDEQSTKWKVSDTFVNCSTLWLRNGRWD